MVTMAEGEMATMSVDHFEDFSEKFSAQRDAVRGDPRWTEAVAAVEAYVPTVGGGMTNDEDGAWYWSSELRPGHDAALQQLVAAREELLRSHPGYAVDTELADQASANGLFDHYEVGADVDGVTTYEPEGTPACLLYTSPSPRDS